jgi:uncharacterized protein YraI
LILTLLILTSFIYIPIGAEAVGTQPTAGRVNLTSGNLNVRASPSVSGKWLASLKAGTTVTLYEKSGDFYRVEYASGCFGYCHADYIAAIAGTTATVNTGSSTLNVRSGGGTSYARIGSLPTGTKVIRLSSEDGWARILYAGTRVGYVSEQYLSYPAYPEISLPVPNFRQTDSRWSWMTLGTSGKTIGKVGCATTGIAMLESYRTGTTVTPAVMCRRLTYTASANVYWPTHYRAVFHYSLSDIYRLLAEGKPVLLGAKSASGGQHWIVVTGCCATDRLTASAFTINDPGATARKTLADFFEDYPYFDKYFYY